MMQTLMRWSVALLALLLLPACRPTAEPVAELSTPTVAPTETVASIEPTPTLAEATLPPTSALTATVVSETPAWASTVTIEGDYYVLGNPAAPLRLIDYSDFL
jgi:hypothetical protein